MDSSSSTGGDLRIESTEGQGTTVTFDLPEAARQAAAGASITQVGGLLAGELLVGVLYAMCGYALFRWLEAQARRGGLQEAY